MNFKNNRWLIFILYILVVYIAIVVIINSYSVHLGPEEGNTQTTVTSRPEKTPEPTSEPMPTESVNPYGEPMREPGRVRNGEATLARLFNVDYATFKKEFGKPIDAMGYRGGCIYQFEEEGPWFCFDGMRLCLNEDGTIIEPKGEYVCNAIYADIKEWLNTTLEINTIEDVKAISGISNFERRYSEYDGRYIYYGENDWYSAHIYEMDDGTLGAVDLYIIKD